MWLCIFRLLLVPLVCAELGTDAANLRRDGRGGGREDVDVSAMGHPHHHIDVHHSHHSHHSGHATAHSHAGHSKHALVQTGVDVSKSKSESKVKNGQDLVEAIQALQDAAAQQWTAPEVAEQARLVAKLGAEQEVDEESGKKQSAEMQSAVSMEQQQTLNSFGQAITEASNAVQRTSLQVSQIGGSIDLVAGSFDSDTKAVKQQLEKASKLDAKEVVQIVNKAEKVLEEGVSVIDSSSGQSVKSEAKTAAKVEKKAKDVGEKLDKVTEDVGKIGDRVGGKLQKAEDTHEALIVKTEAKSAELETLSEANTRILSDAVTQADEQADDVETAEESYKEDMAAKAEKAAEDHGRDLEDYEAVVETELEKSETSSQDVLKRTGNDVGDGLEEAGEAIAAKEEEEQEHFNKVAGSAEVADGRLEGELESDTNKAEHVDEEAQRLADNNKALVALGQESADEVTDSTKNMVEEITAAAEADATAQGTAFAKGSEEALGRAEEAIAQAKARSMDAVVNSVDDSVNKAKKDHAAVAAQNVEVVEDGTKLQAVIDKGMEKTQDAIMNVKKVGGALAAEWDDAADDAKRNTPELLAEAKRDEEKATKDMNAVYKKMTDNAKGTKIALIKEARSVDDEIRGAEREAKDGMQKQYDDSEAELKSLKTVGAPEVMEKLAAANAAVLKVDTQVEKVKNDAFGYIAQAKEQTDAIEPATEKRMTDAKVVVQQGLADLSAKVQSDMKNAGMEQGEMVNQNKPRLQAAKIQLEGITTKIKDDSENAVNKAQSVIDAAAEKVLSQGDTLKEDKEALSRSVSASEAELQRQRAVAQSDIADGDKTIQALQQTSSEDEEKAVAQIRAMASKLGMKLEEEATKNDKDVKDDVKSTIDAARTKVKALVQRLDNESDMTKKKANGIVLELSKAVDELTALQGNTSDDVKKLNAQLKAVRDQRDADNGKTDAAIKAMADQLSREGTTVMDAATKRAGDVVNGASDAASKEVKAASQQIDKEKREIAATIDGFAADGTRITAEETKSTGMLQADLIKVKEETAALAAEVHVSLYAVDRQEKQKENEFKHGMSGLDNEVAAEQAKSKAEADALVTKMQSITAGTKVAIATQRQKEEAALEHVVASAEKEQGSLETPLEEIAENLGSFQGKIRSSEALQDNMAEQSEQEGEKLRGEVQDLSKRFLTVLQKTKQERAGTMGQLSVENDDIFTTLDDAVGTLKHMEGQVVKTVQASVSKVAGDEASVDTNLDKILSLEHYQSQDAVDQVKKDMEKVKNALTGLDTWRSQVTSNTNDWRADLARNMQDMQGDMESMGLDVNEQQSQEQYAIDKLMSDLGDELQHEMRGLNADAAAQIAEMAKKSGIEIAELMRNTELTDEEKATRLAEIKSNAKKLAVKAAMANQGAASEAANTDRMIQAATKDIENTVERIDDLEESGRGSSSNRGSDVSGVVDDLRNLIKSGKDPKVSQMIANQKQKQEAFIQRGSPAEAQLKANWNSAPAADRARATQEAEAFIQQYGHADVHRRGLKPSSLVESDSSDLEAELKEARRAVDEDQAWKAQLDARFPHAA